MGSLSATRRGMRDARLTRAPIAQLLRETVEPRYGRYGSLRDAPMLPLQWPLVGRHEELEPVHAPRSPTRGPTASSSTAPPAWARPAWPTSAWPSPTEQGRNVARATATEGSRDGAARRAGPPAAGRHRRRAVRPGRRRVRGAAGAAATRPSNGPLVLFVDDLHLLDGTSATLVGQLVDADLVFLVATVRTTEPRARRARVAVAPGAGAPHRPGRPRPAGVDTLLHLVLGGPVEASTIAEIWTASEGNVLFVRELVLGALDSGHLVDQRGVWRLVGPLVTTPRLHELRRRPGSRRSTRAPARRSTSSPCGSRPGLVDRSRRSSGASSSRRSTARASSRCAPTAAANR